jgi:hypothetical protein
MRKPDRHTVTLGIISLIVIVSVMISRESTDARALVTYFTSILCSVVGNVPQAPYITADALRQSTARQDRR